MSAAPKSSKSKVATSYKSTTRKAKPAAKQPEVTKIVKRTENREYSIFIDGVALDRASKRLNKKINYEALVKSLCVGSTPAVARYYTLLPVLDDARQSAFYDAVARAGLDVVKKRLPPQGVNRQISTDLEMACDMLAYIMNRRDACDASLEIASGNYSVVPNSSRISRPIAAKEKPAEPGSQETNAKPLKKVIVAVCVGKELSYALNICRHLGAETISADFGSIIGRDVLKGAEKWVDLSFSESIWR